MTEHYTLRPGTLDPVSNRETSRADDETAAILRSLIARVRDADRHGATLESRLRRWLARCALRRALAKASDAALDATDDGRDRLCGAAEWREGEGRSSDHGG